MAEEKKELKGVGNLASTQPGGAGKTGEEKKQGGNKPKKHGKPGRKDNTPKKDNPQFPGSTKPGNDPNWYKTDLVLFEGSTNVQTVHITGGKYNIGPINGTMAVSPEFNPDGIIRVRYDAQIANSRHISDSLNRAMLNLFNVVRGKYTSTVPFGPVDLTAYFIAVGSVLNLIANIKRRLDWVNMFEVENMQIPDLLIKSDLPSDSLYNESVAYAKNIFALNVQINRLSSLALPRGVKYLERCAWLGRKTYYEDHAGIRGNIIYFSPTTLYQYTNDALSADTKLTGSGLKRIKVNQNADISASISCLDSMITHLVTDDNIRQMSGWIKTYVDKERVGLEYAIEYANKEFERLVYDDEVLDIVRNCRFLHQYQLETTRFSNDSSYIIDSDNVVKSFDMSTWADETAPLPEYTVKNTLMRFSAKPSPDLIMVASRMSYTWTLEDDGKYYLDCDMFTVNGMDYTYYNSSHAVNKIEIDQFYYINRAPAEDPFPGIYPPMRKGSEYVPTDFQILGGLDSVPARYVCNWDGSYEGFNQVSPIQIVDYNFVLEGESISRLNTTAVLSQFNFASYTNGEQLATK